jgi:hypothetical protein
MTAATFIAAQDQPNTADAAELAMLAGLELNEGQAETLREGLRVRQDGKWEHFNYWGADEAVLQARALAGLLLFSDQRVVWCGRHVHHAFRRLAWRLTERPQLTGQVERIRAANGEQRIELVNGSRLMFISTRSGAGRGFSADLLVVDDSIGLPAGRRAEMIPMLHAASNPQVWYGR